MVYLKKLCMKLTIKKTDKRHTGHYHWQYVVIVERIPTTLFGKPSILQKIDNLNTIREWCWTTYGPSCELEFWLAINEAGANKNEHWCWHTNYDNYKIYLRTDKEANWFKLKWL